MLLRISSLVCTRELPRAVAIVLFLGLVYTFAFPYESLAQHPVILPPWLARPGSAEDNPTPPPSIPDDYSFEDPQTAFCTDRFSSKYLTDLRDNLVQYCSLSSNSSLTCFNSDTAGRNEIPHSLCIGKGSLLSNSKFLLNCDVQDPRPNETVNGMIPFDNIRQYWYDTGPKYLLNSFVDFVPQLQKVAVREAATVDSHPRRFTLLVKREGEGNMWHCLMEIWSMSMTMDVLRMSTDPDDNGNSYFRVPEDLDNTQVVILDARVDGPYFDLWKLFSGRDPIRLNQIIGNPEARAFFNNTEQSIILPLAGASNPVWQNDWIPRECTRSVTLRAFVHRVLQHYQIPPVVSPKNTNPNTVTVTFIDRKDANTRRLKGQDSLLAAVKAKFPDVEIQAVDFGKLSFPDQLHIAQRTDVLAGIHGAGLTHTMFLRESVTSVVEIQPIDMGKSYMGFRNLANMRGIGYFKTLARPTDDDLDDNNTNPGGNNEDKHNHEHEHEHENTHENGAVSQHGDDNESSNQGKKEGPAVESRHLSRRDSWHRENFEVDTDVFVQVMGAAIQAVYNKNLHQHEVVV